MFGVQPLKDFLERFNCKMMVRAHQCVKNGIAVFGEGLLYTVFSCSNYVDYTGNKCGLLYFPYEGSMQPIQFPACVQIPRNSVRTERFSISSGSVVTTSRNSLTLNVTIVSEKKKPKRIYIPHSSSSMRFSTPCALPHTECEYNIVRPQMTFRKSSTSDMFFPCNLPKPISLPK